MIFGYVGEKLSESGLSQMREISLEASAYDLRELSLALRDLADLVEMEHTPNWHKHLPASLCRSLRCEIVVLPFRNGGEG